MTARIAAALAAIALLLVQSPVVEAQERAGNAHLFRPALYGGGLFAVDTAFPLDRWQPGFRLTYSFASAPLELEFPTGGLQEIVSSAHVFDLQAQISLTKWLEFAIDVPIARHSLSIPPANAAASGFGLLTANDPASNIPTPDVVALDFRYGLKIAFLRLKRFAMAVSLQGSLPFGEELTFAGNTGFTFHPRLLASFRAGRFDFSANVGYLWRQDRNQVLWDDPDTTEQALPLLHIDDELSFGASVTFRLHRIAALAAEFYGFQPLTSSSYEVKDVTRVSAPNPACPANVKPGQPCEVVSTRKIDAPSGFVAEAVGGVIISPTQSLSIAVAAGAGMGLAERRADLRLISTITWLPGAVAAVAARDRDNDGIIDSKDKCPLRPEDKDGFEDDDGCPDPDNDHDGIPDAKDKCPNVAEDLDGYQDKDGCPDNDNDGDGIPDSRDKCPNQPEDKDNYRDDDGCPDNDNDGDGIPDAKDQCPNEPETKNGLQDDDGCPDAAPGIKKGKVQIDDRIRFRTGKAVLRRGSFKTLDNVAKVILANPQAGAIRIEGHTDNTGSTKLNQRLSQARAEAVRRYLIRKGVPARRLQAVGYGATRQIAPNKTKAGRAKNRRVEFVVIAPKK